MKGAVAKCHLAGVRPVMITGDHRATAIAVAKELDIARPGDWSVTGAELDFIPQEVLEEDILLCPAAGKLVGSYPAAYQNESREGGRR